MIGLREDQQMKARLINCLNNTIAQCGRWLACDGGVSETDVLDDTPKSRASTLPPGMCMGLRSAAESAASKAAG